MSTVGCQGFLNTRIKPSSGQESFMFQSSQKLKKQEGKRQIIPSNLLSNPAIWCSIQHSHNMLIVSLEHRIHKTLLVQICSYFSSSAWRGNQGRSPQRNIIQVVEQQPHLWCRAFLFDCVDYWKLSCVCVCHWQISLSLMQRKVAERWPLLLRSGFVVTGHELVFWMIVMPWKWAIASRYGQLPDAKECTLSHPKPGKWLTTDRSPLKQ